MEEKANTLVKELESKLRKCEEEISSSQKEKERIKLELQKATQENDDLVKHHNHKQRLSYHMQVKKETNQLREENLALRKVCTNKRLFFVLLLFCFCFAFVLLLFCFVLFCFVLFLF